MSAHGSPLDFFAKFGANIAIILVAIGMVIIGTAIYVLDVQFGKSFNYILLTAPIWLPLLTFFLFFENWLYYVQKEFDIKQGRTTIEIKLPQDVFKSPEAMELVLIQMHQTAAPDNHMQTYIDGKHPPKYSLELVSRGGDVRFYINTPKKKFKNLIETQLYAQYPGIEVHELDIDYAAEVPWDTKKFAYFSLHFGLKKDDALPIKTYIEFGMDRLPKEEFKIDPITSLLEALGSIGPGEFFWVQILIDANREVTFKEGALRTSPNWKPAAEAYIKTIIEKANKRVSSETLNMMNLSDGERETIKAIERSIGKNAYNTVIRGMYIAKKESFNPGERIGALITGWRAYDDLNRNAIGVKWRTDVDWPWQDKHGHHVEHMKKQELNDYKRRSYTVYGKDTPKIMTVEELATIFHLPGKVALTPSLGRIPSKRAEAPANLPTG